MNYTINDILFQNKPLSSFGVMAFTKFSNLPLHFSIRRMRILTLLPSGDTLLTLFYTNNVINLSLLLANTSTFMFSICGIFNSMANVGHSSIAGQVPVLDRPRSAVTHDTDSGVV